MVTVFTSHPLRPSLRRRLIDGLSDIHRDHPLLPSDPRGAAARVADSLQRWGLTAVRVRGRLALTAAEVDHVWLAVIDDDRTALDPAPWVLDAVFPLHEPLFAGSLPGYVAGTTSRAELTELAAAARIEDRVIGELPPHTVYRAAPGWVGRSG